MGWRPALLKNGEWFGQGHVEIVNPEANAEEVFERKSRQSP
jgi:hypothetical protein